MRMQFGNGSTMSGNSMRRQFGSSYMVCVYRRNDGDEFIYNRLWIDSLRCVVVLARISQCWLCKCQ